MTSKQTKKCTQKNRRVHLVLANYSRVRGLTWTAVDTPSDSPLEKTEFPFPSRYQFK